MTDATSGPSVTPSPTPAIRRPDHILNFKDSARILQFLPSGTVERHVVLFGRNNFAADHPFIDHLIDHFRRHAIALNIFEAPLERLFGGIDRHRFMRRAPLIVRRAAKVTLLAVKPRYWKSILPRLRGDAAHAKSRADSFVAALQQMHPKPSIAMGRSAGGLAITRNAQALDLNALVCLGYPFRNPEQGDDPTRYAHLAALQTPCLILQGERDPYGDINSAPQYALSPTTSLSFIDANHEMAFSEEALQILLDRIVAFMRVH